MEDMEQSRKNIPVAFNGNWRSLLGMSKMRAVDWLDFILYVVPTLVVKRLADNNAKGPTMALVRLCQHSLQYSVTQADIVAMERDMRIWHQYLLGLVEDNVLKVSAFTPNQHYLSHIPDIIRKIGLLRYFSARPLERVIGVYSRLISSTVAAGSNAGNIMVKLAMSRSIEPMLIGDTHGPAQDDIVEIDSVEPQLWGFKKFASHNFTDPIAGVSSTAFARALAAFYKQMRLDINFFKELTYCGSLWHDHKVYGSVLQHSDRKRAAYYVQMCIDVDRLSTSNRANIVMEEKYYFGKVYFYFQAKNNDSRTFALVGIYKASCDEISDTVYFLQSANDQLFVVDCTSIDNFVGILKESDGRNYCIWPNMVCGNNHACVGNTRYI
ncbi:hypothetical protein EC973_005216 [Apophysomyces ossiformis]|uniref:Uncharacterized protein n=1 Tax=Apophysomyces ossiformis TaxID=679940 RepID=A0A8H7EVH3_9FUNG|nr:hypothetical protein EC973_005216 [Apophysomyces ossiformis]